MTAGPARGSEVSPAEASVHEVVAARLRGADQVYTRGRRELVELMRTFARPVSIPELLELHPTLTQSSVYRNMTDLEAVGVVQKVLGGDDRTRFELAEELIGHHHHLVCTVCGTVDDFVAPTAVEQMLDDALHAALGDSSFEPLTHRLDILGVCSRCR